MSEPRKEQNFPFSMFPVRSPEGRKRKKKKKRAKTKKKKRDPSSLFSPDLENSNSL